MQFPIYLSEEDAELRREVERVVVKKGQSLAGFTKDLWRAAVQEQQDDGSAKINNYPHTIDSLTICKSFTKELEAMSEEELLRTEKALEQRKRELIF